MSLHTLIETHGYWIVLLGTLLEGETILVLGGIAAHEGALRLPGVILAAFFGSFLGDLFFFQLGRHHGSAVLARRPGWRAGIGRADLLLKHHATLLIIGFRFLYGLRTVTPFAIGMSSTVSTRRFVLLSSAGAAVWAMVVGSAGYAVGHALEIFLGKARHYELVTFGVVAGVGAIVWLVHFFRSLRDVSR